MMILLPFFALVTGYAVGSSAYLQIPPSAMLLTALVSVPEVQNILAPFYYLAYLPAKDRHLRELGVAAAKAKAKWIAELKQPRFKFERFVFTIPQFDLF